ncbi:MAG: helix-turn-helix transcriptional regulator [Chlamydiota bacterium]
MDAKKLGKKIKLARVEKDMTQADLGKVTGLLQKSISLYETGQALPNLETLEKIAKALEKSFGYFLDT